MNPQHTVPTIVDKGFALPESRSIIVYLADKYGKQDSFYPRDIKKHTTINQKLFYDAELMAKVTDYMRPQMFEGAPADAVKFQKIIDSLAILDTELKGRTFVTSDNFTIADVALLVTLSTIELVSKELLAKFKNIPEYLQRCKESAVGYDGMANNMLNSLAAFIDEMKGI